MRAAYFLLLVLISISPCLFYFEGPILHALIVGFAAVTIGVVAEVIPSNQARHLANVVRPFAIFSSLVALWLLIQMLPVPKNWAHPIWSDAGAALGKPILGSITVDPGATFVAICRYFSAIGILLVAAALTIDRVRADRVLFWTVGSITTSVVLQMVYVVVPFPVSAETDVGLRTCTPALSALGLILGLAAVVRLLESRFEKSPGLRRHGIAVPLSFVLVACAICGLGVALFGGLRIATVTAAGLSSFGVILLIRRLRFGMWTGDSRAVVRRKIGIQRIHPSLAF